MTTRPPLKKVVYAMLVLSPLMLGVQIGFLALYHHDTGHPCPWWLSVLSGLVAGNYWSRLAIWLAGLVYQPQRENHK